MFESEILERDLSVRFGVYFNRVLGRALQLYGLLFNVRQIHG